MAVFKAGRHTFSLGDRTYVMGILNITPDSFSDGGHFYDPDRALERALEIEALGADILDIGAQSTGPSAKLLSDEDELKRLSAFLPVICSEIKIPISVDTFYPLTARFALENGVSIINDVSAEINPEIGRLVKDYGAGWIIMHNRGGALATDTVYEGGVVNAVKSFFNEAAAKTLTLGLEPAQICFDPGIGFGKSMPDNLELIRKTADLRTEGYGLLVGVSRKRVIGAATGETKAEKRDPGTIAAHTVAIAGGADFIRVHDVGAAVQAAKMADAIYRRI
ncbi:MAG TPA: dihydropteroate synthase [Clostridiales bacterium]|nr:dihydropteroate synthase [Clostridiales bacterium]HRT82079.1 dihydropteroate synthase [Oscillospiraceae bacterium]